MRVQLFWDTSHEACKASKGKKEKAAPPSLSSVMQDAWQLNVTQSLPFLSLSGTTLDMEGEGSAEGGGGWMLRFHVGQQTVEPG